MYVMLLLALWRASPPAVSQHFVDLPSKSLFWCCVCSVRKLSGGPLCGSMIVKTRHVGCVSAFLSSVQSSSRTCSHDKIHHLYLKEAQCKGHLLCCFLKKNSCWDKDRFTVEEKSCSTCAHTYGTYCTYMNTPALIPSVPRVFMASGVESAAQHVMTLGVCQECSLACMCSAFEYYTDIYKLRHVQRWKKKKCIYSNITCSCLLDCRLRFYTQNIWKLIKYGAFLYMKNCF